jgi:hypothetical protein
MGKDGVCDKCGKDYSGDWVGDAEFAARLCPACAHRAWEELQEGAQESRDASARAAEVRSERAHEMARRIAQGSANRGELNLKGCELHFMEVARISVEIVDAVDAALKKED